MSMKNTISFQLDGEEIQAQEGQTIAEAILTRGVTEMRHTRDDKPRCAFCGMGVCYECRMIVDGVPNTRTCVTLVTAGCKVETQHDNNIKNSGVKYD